MLLVLPCAQAHADSIEEAQLKAAMLLQFPLDTKWPEGKPGGAKDVGICVVGDSKIADLQSLFAAASKKFGRNYKLVKKTSISALDASCHIAYISNSESVSSEDLSKLAGKSILTASDIQGFASKGGMVEFTPLNNKMKIGVINRRAAENGQIMIAAGVLELALKVIDE